jgi:hypothetical protein
MNNGIYFLEVCTQNLKGIQNIWIGQFSYNDYHRIEFNLDPLNWYY